MRIELSFDLPLYHTIPVFFIFMCLFLLSTACCLEMAVMVLCGIWFLDTSWIRA